VNRPSSDIIGTYAVANLCVVHIIAYYISVQFVFNLLLNISFLDGSDKLGGVFQSALSCPLNVAVLP